MSAKATRRRTPMRRVAGRRRPSVKTAQRAITPAMARAERDLALDRARRAAEFISHASHEIRTPLHGIVGFSTLLLGTKLSDEQRQFANSLHASIESLLAIVNDVLDVSTLDAGAMRLESAGFNLIALVRGTADMFAEAASAKGLALRVDTEAVTHSNVCGDPGRLRQILANLVSNAVKFTDAGSVTVRAATRAARRGAIEVHLSVADTGPGIPRGRGARLFAPFSRLSQPGAAAKPGTGLGLSISQHLVDLMGGTITIKSSRARGSTFSFTIRLGEDTRPIAIRELEGLDVGQLCVYVADDDSHSLSELLLCLAAAGVSVAGSGSTLGLPEALRTAIAGGRRPDVALVGHVRHDGADLSVARVVGADPLLADVPLVLVPMSGVRGRAREVREAGYRAYIPRPFQGNELLQCLRATVLKGRERPADNSLLITRHNVTDQSEVQPAGRVLVADDDPAGRQVACLQIARLGYLVDAVAGGKAAVAAAATGSYQLILMDCQMPDMDGLTATAAIRRNERPEQRTCIVALTADVSAVQRERCAEAGMDGFLEKPLRTQTLASLLTTHLRRGQEQSAIDVVDATALGLAEAGIEPEIALDLVREYLAGAAQTTEQLAQRRLDARSIHSAAHRLLGSARILGLARFERIWASLCDRTEHAGVEVPPAAIDDLREACADLTAWIESHQGRQHV